MKLTPKVQKAVNMAAEKHFGQKRRGISRPYVVHPFSVAVILSEYTDDENIIVAGLLHDVLEDVPGYPAENLEKDFGKEVANIVKEITEDKDPDDTPEENRKTWQCRKELYLENLSNDGFGALMVACADKIHNLQSLAEAHGIQGEEIWEIFNAPKEKVIWFYREVLKIVSRRLDNLIVSEFRETLAKVEKLS